MLWVFFCFCYCCLLRARILLGRPVFFLRNRISPGAVCWWLWQAGVVVCVLYDIGSPQATTHTHEREQRAARERPPCSLPSSAPLGSACVGVAAAVQNFAASLHFSSSPAFCFPVSTANYPPSFQFSASRISFLGEPCRIHLVHE